MNWFLMALSAILGGVATWFWSVRKVHRKVPVYEAGAGPKPAAAAPLADASSLDEPADAASMAVSTGASSEEVSTEEVSTEEPSAESVDAEDDAETLPAVQAAAFAGGTSRTAAKASKKKAPEVAVAEAGATGAALTGANEVDSPALPGVDVPVSAAGNPHGWTIKGNADSGLYHTVKSPYYKRTKAEAWFETEADAEAAGFVRWDRREKKPAEPVALVSVPDGPYGPGSAAAGADGSGPAGWTIKGNADSMLFHTLESPYYKRTKAEAWFETEDAAEAAGFTRWDRRDKKSAEPVALVTVPDGPYGPGSAAPGPDGSGPDGWTVKGNADSGLYHALASPYYKRTKAEVWFQTEEAAVAAGFAHWDSRRKKKA